MSSMNGGVIGVTAAVNGVGLLAAAADRSWGAVAVMMLLPLANLLVAIVFSGVGAAWRQTADFSLGEHLAVSWLVPICATVQSAGDRLDEPARLLTFRNATRVEKPLLVPNVSAAGS